MIGRNELTDFFFRSTDSVGEYGYEDILRDVQNYCTNHHAELFRGGKNARSEQLLREYIGKRVSERQFSLPDLTQEDLRNKLYEDMAGISFLGRWIYDPKIEEVNINRYDDIEVIYAGGRSQKIPEKFASPQQALDVMRRILSGCGVVLDDAMPSAIGYLGQNIRIEVDKAPIIPEGDGVNASIRVVNQQSISDDKLLASGSVVPEMLNFLSACIRHGVSVCIAGATRSGKTTFMSWLLTKVPDNRRLITVEEESREFDLVKRGENGEIVNSVGQLLTRKSDNPAMNIDQAFLLERILRKDPDVIGVGEMRSAKEAMAAAEASRTGHTVITTIHSNSAASTYKRMMTMVRLNHSIDEDVLMQIMVEAYPIVVYTKQLDDGSRKVMEIIEGQDYRNGELQYRTLYRFETSRNLLDDKGRIKKVQGKHRRVNCISSALMQRMLENGITEEEMREFTGIPGAKAGANPGKPEQRKEEPCSGQTS